MIEILTESITVTILGMGIVFLTLALIAFVVSQLRRVGDESETNEKEVPISQYAEKTEYTEYSDADIPPEIIAAITAAIGAMMPNDERGFKVVSVERSKFEPWNRTARKEYLKRV